MQAMDRQTRVSRVRKVGMVVARIILETLKPIKASSSTARASPSPTLARAVHSLHLPWHCPTTHICITSGFSQPQPTVIGEKESGLFFTNQADKNVVASDVCG